MAVKHRYAGFQPPVEPAEEEEEEEEASGVMAVLLETTLGDIVIDLFTEERPKCKKSFKITTFLLGSLLKTQIY